VPSRHDLVKNENLMDVVGSDKGEAPIVVQIARIALLAAMITIAVWLDELRIGLARRIFL